jgi:hypothetical protein
MDYGWIPTLGATMRNTGQREFSPGLISTKYHSLALKQGLDYAITIIAYSIYWKSISWMTIGVPIQYPVGKNLSNFSCLAPNSFEFHNQPPSSTLILCLIYKSNSSVQLLVLSSIN